MASVASACGERFWRLAMALSLSRAEASSRMDMGTVVAVMVEVVALNL
jgi:hypothetical protein